MEPRRNLRVLPSGVLPSNAPTLSEETAEQLSILDHQAETLTPQICQHFNHGLNCRTDCSLHHVCFTCQQPDHGANECKLGVLRVTSGNAGSTGSGSRTISAKAEFSQSYGIRPSIFSNHPESPCPTYPTPRWEQHTNSIGNAKRALPNHWHCEFETPRYRAYREKCRQKGTKEAVKWPDRVEDAFQMAIRYYRRRGRKKAELQGKQCGGNEFIAHFIERNTGVKRDRKQVSSHIQVLKAFLGENRRWMSLVVDIAPEKSTKRHRESSCYEEPTTVWTDHDHEALQRTFASDMLPSIDVFDSNMGRGPTIRSVEFEMNLYKGPGVESQVVLHTYTTIQAEIGSNPKELEEIIDWREMFPHLAAYYDRGEAQSPMFFFESDLYLMNRHPGTGCSLGTNLIIDFTEGMNFTGWCSLTRIYEEKGNEIDLSEIAESTLILNSSYNEIICREVVGSTDMQLEVRLKSKWWAQKFFNFIHENQKAEALAQKFGNCQIVKDDDEKTRQYLREISVMQELWATPRVAGSQPQRMAILLWRFKQARDGEAGTTSWRRIIPPVSPFQIQSPSPRLLQAPMSLDSTLVEPTISSLTQPYAEYYKPQPSIFVDTSEPLLALGPTDDSSPESPQTNDYRSFPSSTSTSFPSSISNSTYGIHSSHELGNDAQDSGYSIFESFDSQDSTYNSAINSQESYESQDGLYHSQDPLYHTVTTPLYDYPTNDYPPPHPDASDDATATNDFTSGEIQLLYAPHPDPAPTYDSTAYEAPLIAPRANMIQQSQVIEHLENFEYHDPSEPHEADLDPDQHDLQQTYANHFEQHNLDLNLLATQFNAWEDQMNSQQELERHDGGHVVEDFQAVEELEKQEEFGGEGEERGGVEHGDDQVGEVKVEY